MFKRLWTTDASASETRIIVIPLPQRMIVPRAKNDLRRLFLRISVRNVARVYVQFYARLVYPNELSSMVMDTAIELSIFLWFW